MFKIGEVSTCCEGMSSVEFCRDLCWDLCYFAAFTNDQANTGKTEVIEVVILMIIMWHSVEFQKDLMKSGRNKTENNEKHR